VQYHLRVARHIRARRREFGADTTRANRIAIFQKSRKSGPPSWARAHARARMRESRVAIRGLLRDGDCSNSDEIISVCFSERITCSPFLNAVATIILRGIGRVRVYAAIGAFICCLPDNRVTHCLDYVSA